MSQRLHRFPDGPSVEAALEQLADHEDGPLAEYLVREPGHKERRWRDTLQAPAVDAGLSPGMETGASPDVAPVTADHLEARVAALEEAVVELRRLVETVAARRDH